MLCHWATNRTDPQNLLSTTLDVPLQRLSRKERKKEQISQRKIAVGSVVGNPVTWQEQSGPGKTNRK